MIFSFLLSLSLASSGLAALNHPQKRAQVNPDPAAGGSEADGWQNFPDIIDATSFPTWQVTAADKRATIPAYQSTNDPAVVRRAVIILPGKPRDCWYYWNVMNNALYVATEFYSDIRREEISLLGPCFFTQKDVDAGAITGSQLTFGDTTWVSGHANTGPSGIEGISSFDVLDSLVSYYMDRNNFPNLNVVVIAGHSAGAQMAQRYIGLRKSTTDDDRLHFWIGNPGSIMWLSEDRPAPNATCENVDDYKYGLNKGFPSYSTKDVRKKRRKGIVERYLNRYAHYAWGLEDNGPGDIRCQAVTQGNTHLERGQNFEALLKTLNGDGNLPPHTTVDYVEGVSHDNVGMMNSPQGTEMLFRHDYNGSTTTFVATPDTDASVALQPTRLILLSSLLIGLYSFFH